MSSMTLALAASPSSVRWRVAWRVLPRLTRTATWIGLNAYVQIRQQLGSHQFLLSPSDLFVP